MMRNASIAGSKRPAGTVPEAGGRGNPSLPPLGGERGFPFSTSCGGGELSQAEQERIAGNVQRLRQLMPEAVPLVKALFSGGLIPGWRAIEYVGPHRQPPGIGLTLAEIHVGPFATLPEVSAPVGRRR